MSSQISIVLNINGIDKQLSLSDAFLLCNQLVVSNSPHTLAAIKQLLAQPSLNINQHQQLFQLAFNFLLKQQNYRELQILAKQASSLMSDWAIGHYAFSVAQRYLRNPEDALNALQKAITLMPSQTSWQRLLGTMYKEAGKFEQALAQFNLCIEQSPNDSENYWLRSDIDSTLNNDEINLLTYTATTAATDGSPNNQHLQAKAYAAFSLFRHYDQQQNYQQASHFLTLGNTALSALHRFDIDKEVNEHQQIAEVFTGEFLATSTLQTSSNSLGEYSIFICGLPRTGTTLVEQILASHSQINAGDELFYLANASAKSVNQHKLDTPFPFWAKQLSNTQWQHIGEDYEHQCQHLAKGNFLTDKMPLNYKAIGLIHFALPKAKIIYCQRERQDTVFGCYKQILGAGNGFSNHLEQLNKMFDAHTELMSHWLEHLQDKIFVLDYQALINNQQQVTEALCEFLGVEFEVNMLEFYRNTHSVHTVSSSQVRQPLTAKFQGHWQHYEALL